MSTDLQYTEKNLLSGVVADLQALIPQIEAFVSEADNRNRCESLQQFLLKIDAARDVLQCALSIDVLFAMFEDFAPNADLIDIKGLDVSEILRAVSQRRIAEYPTRRKAAASLGIDVRTLHGYASGTQASTPTDD